MARLIQTEKEVEGRCEDVWLLVEEDALEQWPSGPREVVGRPAPRVDGPVRARGEATFTADLHLPGLLHTAVLRSPHAHAGSGGSTSRRRSRRPACAPRSGPATPRRSRTSAARGRAVAAVCAETLAQARRRSRSIVLEWEDASRGSTPTRRSRTTSSSRARERERGDVERGLAEADAVVEARFRTEIVLHNSWRPTARRAAGSATRSRSSPRPSTSGACGRASRRRPGCRRTACASSASTSAAASARRPTPATTR